MLDKNELLKLPSKVLIGELESRGHYFVSTMPPKASGKTFKPKISKVDGNKYKLGIVSCTHLGSKYQQLSHLWSFYKECKKKGISLVLHCGDLVDGEKMYRGQEYELFAHGATPQKNYAIENYPKIKGITTKVIMGNHDESFWKNGGYNIVEAICAERDDMDYLGDYLAYIKIEGMRLGIMHGESGVPYARSYRVQKILEQLSPEQRPDVLCIGHWHINSITPDYNNSDGLAIACFQAQTPYLVRKGLNPSVSGVIAEFEINKSKLVSSTYQYRNYPNVIKNDY